MRVRTGVDALLRRPDEYLESSKVGLVTNPTGVNRELRSTLDELHKHQEIDLKAVFGPEHGARGNVQDALPVDSWIDPATGLSVYSLYGECVKPTLKMLEEFDSLIFDIQDVGVRFYTYASTLTYVMEAASEQNLNMVVLDRPNPLNGIDVEGNILEPDFASFVGLHEIPIRHGLTIGELAQLINEKIGTKLQVIELEGWERGMWFDETGLPWVQPSPNIPTLATTTVYPGTCFFEGINASEGRGTTRPFEYIGAPWMNGNTWAKSLNGLGLGGVIFRPCHFTPTFDKFHGELCNGVQLHITDRDAFRPVEAGLHMISTALELWPDDLKWLPHRSNSNLHFDLLTGTNKVRRDLCNGVKVNDIIDSWSDALEVYIELSEKYLLYATEEIK